jgi:ATP dependent DNA ligase domain
LSGIRGRLSWPLPPGISQPCTRVFCLLASSRLASRPKPNARIKHDGFRVIARKDGNRVRLYSRPGNDLTDRFPLIVEALVRLRSRSCIIDGEAVCCDDNGMPSFDRIRYRRNDGNVFLYAFDLIELNGNDLRRDPLEVRKATLASLPRCSPSCPRRLCVSSFYRSRWPFVLRQRSTR